MLTIRLVYSQWSRTRTAFPILSNIGHIKRVPQRNAKRIHPSARAHTTSISSDCPCSQPFSTDSALPALIEDDQVVPITAEPQNHPLPEPPRGEESQATQNSTNKLPYIRIAQYLRDDRTQFAFEYFLSKSDQNAQKGVHEPKWLLWSLGMFMRRGTWAQARHIRGKIDQIGYILDPHLRAHYNALSALHTAPTPQYAMFDLMECVRDPDFTESQLRHLLMRMERMGYHPPQLSRLLDEFSAGKSPEGRPEAYQFSGDTMSAIVACCIRGDAHALAKRWLGRGSHGQISITSDSVDVGQPQERDLDQQQQEDQKNLIELQSQLEAAQKNAETKVKPYEAALTALLSHSTISRSTVKSILDRMGEDGVQPNLAIINLLLNQEINWRQYGTAFQVYEHLCTVAVSDPSFQPNHHTFKSLFKALRRLHAASSSTKRTKHSRHERVPDNVIPPRQLFQEMMDAHVKKTNGLLRRRGIVTSSLMNTVLRLFLSTNDLAQAAVVLRAFIACRIKPTILTIQYTMTAVLVPLRTAILKPTVTHDVWLSRFFGRVLPSSARTALALNPTQLLQLLLHIARISPHMRVGTFELASITQGKSRNSYLLRHPKDMRKARRVGRHPHSEKLLANYSRKWWTGAWVRLPTLQELLGVRQPHKWARWDADPLLSLIERTLRASADVFGSKNDSEGMA